MFVGIQIMCVLLHVFIIDNVQKVIFVIQKVIAELASVEWIVIASMVNDVINSMQNVNGTNFQ